MQGEIKRAITELERLTDEYKRVIASLNESEETLELAISGSNGGLWYLFFDPEHPDIIPDEIYISPVLKGFIGYGDHEFPNSIKAWKERIVPEDLILVDKSAREHFEGKRDIHRVEYRIYHRDGSIRWIHSRGKILRDDTGRPIKWAGIDWDITNRKQIENELMVMKDEVKSLSKSLLNKLEAERRYIARELHDEIGQALTAVKINLQSLQRITDTGQFTKRLMEAIATLDRALNQVRNMSLNLRPSLIDDLGLVPTVRWYLDRISTATGIDIGLSVVNMDSRFERELEIACFRVIQEAINNAIRHANPYRMEVTLQREGDNISISVSDNGSGFDVENAMAEAKRGKSFGIIAMKERVELSGGKLEISSETNKGTHIKALFPVKRV
ncbi:MAG: PAS domain-containing protein [Syntrophorhabdaceae bacterium]|nr:PAS domain-containing protein [Syntrophorhabdaceae bacterium]